MGMYTELVLSLELENGQDFQNDILPVLNEMVGGSGFLDGDCEMDMSDTLGERWNFMFNCSSHYHTPISVTKLEYLPYAEMYVLFVRCDFKNYDDEIDKFLDWISPYVNKSKSEGHYYGHYRYEEDDKVTLINF